MSPLIRTTIPISQVLKPPIKQDLYRKKKRNELDLEVFLWITTTLEEVEWPCLSWTCYNISWMNLHQSWLRWASILKKRNYSWIVVWSRIQRKGGARKGCWWVSRLSGLGGWCYYTMRLCFFLWWSGQLTYHYPFFLLEIGLDEYYSFITNRLEGMGIHHRLSHSPFTTTRLPPTVSTLLYIP